MIIEVIFWGIIVAYAVLGAKKGWYLQFRWINSLDY